MKIGFLLALGVYGHSNMLTPKPRGNRQWWGYCSRGEGCDTACDAPKEESPFSSPFFKRTTVRRGQVIPVEWLRQNHPGGFVRLSMAPFGQSNRKSVFDKNAVKYVCYETNCREDYHDPNLGKHNGPGYQLCSTKIKIPNNLPDGPVTLQWTWFGGGVYYAQKTAAFANYVSCSDMVIKGGNRYTRKKKKPTFKGGDAATKNKNQCRYWSTNSVFGCPQGAEKGAKCGYGFSKRGPPKEWLKLNSSRRNRKSH